MPRRSNRTSGSRELTAHNLSPEGREFTSHHPALSLKVFCQLSGVAVVAYVDWLDSKGKLCRTEIANTEFRPQKVTERLVVEWGERCLRAWLEDQLDPKGPPLAWRSRRTPEQDE